MDIIKEQVDELNAVVKIQLSPEDYLAQVEKSLKDYTKKVALPGFRPGKVPAGMIKKMHGKLILIEEVNKIISNSLYKYINENKIEILGNPLPKENSEKKIDWDNQTNFEFSYDLGLAPQINLSIDEKHKFNQYLIKVDEKIIADQTENFRKRYGKVSSVEVSEQEDVLHILLTELDANGNTLESGIQKGSTLMIKNVKDEQTHQNLVGLKVADKITVDPSNLSENSTDLSAMLGITNEEIANISSNFELKVENISRMQAADLNQDLFDKVFGEGNVASEVEFKEKIIQQMQNDYDDLTEGKLLNEVAEYLIENLKISLPDEFLKKWMVAVSEKPITLEEIEKEYNNYSKGLRWQLIENKIVRENDIKITPEELKDFARKTVRSYYSRYGIWNAKEEELDGIVNNMIKDKEELKRLNDKAYDQKILEFFKKTYKLNTKEVTFEEYTNETQVKNQ